MVFKLNMFLNRLIVIVPIVLLFVPFINGLGCHGRFSGEAKLPIRDIKFTCSTGVYDIYNYFPDGSIRHQKGLFGYFMNTAIFISISQEYINLRLSDKDLQTDVINHSDRFFKLKMNKKDKDYLTIEYLYDSTDTSSKVVFDARFNGKLGFMD